MKHVYTRLLAVFSALLLSVAANAFTVSISASQVSCFGGCNGAATATPAGGVAPYTYSWSNAATTQNINGLCTGGYTVTVVDALAATATATVFITQPTQALVASPTSTNTSCANVCDGTLSPLMYGGTPSYTYLWSPSVPVPGNVCPGTYTLSVTDSHGCTATGVTTITQPLPVNVTITPSNPTICTGSQVTMNASGATTYTWVPGNLSGASITVSPSVSSTYTVTGVNANGCSGTASTTVFVAQLPTATSTAIEAGCNMMDGSGTVTPSGNGPFTYNWFPAGGNAATATGLSPGNYNVVIADINGCSITTTVTVNDSCNFVWPGDADDDAVADNTDILAIGIANNATGTTRANATLNWIGQPSAVWGQTLLNGTDYKFVDCNGDGIITPADTNAVIQNFGFTHNNREGGIPVYDASLPDLTVTMGQTILASNSQGTLAVAFGSQATPVANFYGLAFTLNFDPAQINAASFHMNMNGTWLGNPATDLMGVVLNAGTGTGAVQIALTRLDHQNVNGFGGIAALSFMTTGDLVGTGNTQNVNFTISDVTVIGADETPQNVNTVNDSVIVADPLITSIISTQNPQQLSAYPNPFTETVQINLPAAANGKLCTLILTDATGRVVREQQTNGPTATIERGTLARGIYFCSIRCEGQLTGTLKLVVN